MILLIAGMVSRASAIAASTVRSQQMPEREITDSGGVYGWWYDSNGLLWMLTGTGTPAIDAAMAADEGGGE